MCLQWGRGTVQIQMWVQTFGQGGPSQEGESSWVTHPSTRRQQGGSTRSNGAARARKGAEEEGKNGGEEEMSPLVLPPQPPPHHCTSLTEGERGMGSNPAKARPMQWLLSQTGCVHLSGIPCQADQLLPTSTCRLSQRDRPDAGGQENTWWGRRLGLEKQDHPLARQASSHHEGGERQAAATETQGDLVLDITPTSAESQNYRLHGVTHQCVFTWVRSWLGLAASPHGQGPACQEHTARRPGAVP